MGAIQNLIQYNWFIIVSAVISAMLAFKFLSELFDWFVSKFGLETKAMREKKELKDSIKRVADSNAKNEKHIEHLIFAQKEMLAEKINEKYKYYLSIEGVPEDERDEFISLHDAYKGLGGNHTSDAKFEYCMTRLPIIPVEKRLAIDED